MVECFLTVAQQRLQARTQCFALGQVDPRLQRLKHSLHRPALPVLEGHEVDLQLPADLRGLAPIGPDRQNRLNFFHGGKDPSWWTPRFVRL